MRKSLFIILALALILSLSAGCGDAAGSPVGDNASNERQWPDKSEKTEADDVSGANDDYDEEGVSEYDSVVKHIEPEPKDGPVPEPEPKSELELMLEANSTDTLYKWGVGYLSPDAILNRVEIAYDLTELTLVDFDLGLESYFETIPHISSLGNRYMTLSPVESIRDPEGVITHDSPRIVSGIYPIDDPSFYDAVTVLEDWLLQILEDRIALPSGSMHTNQDRTIAVLPLRGYLVFEGLSEINDGKVIGEELSQFLFAKVMEENNEIITMNYYTWAISTDSFSSDRYEALIEFGELIGFDFTEHFDGVGIFDPQWFA